MGIVLEATFFFYIICTAIIGCFCNWGFLDTITIGAIALFLGVVGASGLVFVLGPILLFGMIFGFVHPAFLFLCVIGLAIGSLLVSQYAGLFLLTIVLAL